MERPSIAELRELAADILKTVIRTQIEKIRHAEEIARKLRKKARLEEGELRLLEEQVKEVREAAKAIRAYAHKIPARILKMIVRRLRRVKVIFKHLPIPEAVRETLGRMLEEAIKEVETAGRRRGKVRI